MQEGVEDIRREYGDRFADLPEQQAAEIGHIGAERIMAWIKSDLERMRIHFDSWFSEARVISSGDFQSVMTLKCSAAKYSGSFLILGMRSCWATISGKLQVG